MSGDAAESHLPLELLLEVQDLDTAISQLQHRKATLEERRELARVEAALDSLQVEIADAEAGRSELAQRQSDLEAQIGATSARRRTIEQRLYAARGTPARDLQAMDEEIRHLSQRLSEMEDTQLDVMVELEPIDASLEALGAERARLSAQADALRRALAQAETVLDDELTARVAARRATAAGLPEPLRERYETLRSRLGGTGAARLVGSRCSGCHLELPSMEVDRIRHLPPGSVVTCEQCGRILVPQPTPGRATA
jgi:uncharacterized protein